MCTQLLQQRVLHAAVESTQPKHESDCNDIAQIRESHSAAMMQFNPHTTRQQAIKEIIIILCHSFGSWFWLTNVTAAKVNAPPASCSGVRVSPSKPYPMAAAKHGVRNVRLDRAVRLPLDALKKKTP